jgi:hypothetical protein
VTRIVGKVFVRRVAEVDSVDAPAKIEVDVETDVNVDVSADSVVDAPEATASRSKAQVPLLQE